MKNLYSKVTIQIVTYNGKHLIASCLDSILNQTYRDFKILIIDNASQDGTVEFVRSNYPQVAIFENNKNQAFAKANNQGFHLLKSDYVLICNQDVVLEPDWLEKIIIKAEDKKYDNFGSFGGKLLKLKLINAEIGELEKTNKIDSCGLKLLKNHRVVELGAGEDKLFYSEINEVFGHSGALVLYRRQALEDVIIKDNFHPNGDYLDSNFVFYKEDVDLAWRLQLAGWRSLFIPDAVAYHIRTFSGSEKNGLWEIISNRFKQSRLARYYSYRNHLLLILENQFFSNLIYYFPQIFWYELRKLIFIIFLEPNNLKVLLEIIKMWPQIKKKRRQSISNAKVTAQYIRDWIN